MSISGKYLALSLAAALAVSCTDVIDVDLEDVPQQIVVDAWINNVAETQNIRLTLSQGYFDNQLASGVEGATVTVVDDKGKEFLFEDEGNGNYSWTPEGSENLGSPGTRFDLFVEWEGNAFSASSTMNRVPDVDSIVVEFRDDVIAGPDGHYAEFFARDFVGPGDTYWIKTFKNGEFLNKPSEMNLAYDAAFSRGAETDGLIFITPLREAVNRIPDPDGEDDADVPPWSPGDTISVEIHSINEEAFDFLRIARDQMTNGQNTIFAIPIANAGTNLRTVEGNQKALGWFCVSAVSSLTRTVSE